MANYKSFSVTHCVGKGNDEELPVRTILTEPFSGYKLDGEHSGRMCY